MSVEIGVLRAEAVPFLISPRNSAAAVAHMVEKTGTQYMLVSEDLRNLAMTAIESMQNPPRIALMPNFQDLYPTTEEDVEFMPPLRSRNLNDAAIILHSSGSAPRLSSKCPSDPLVIRIYRIPKAN